MRYTEDYGAGVAGMAMAGLILTAATGLTELLVAAGVSAGRVLRGAFRLAGEVAPHLRGSGDNAPHVALLRVPGEFVAGAWRRV